MMIILLLLLSVVVLLASVVFGTEYGREHGRPFLGFVAGLVIGISLGGMVLKFAGHLARIELAKNEAREIGVSDYRAVAAFKGMHCDVDRRIAAAMEDGRISRGEFDRIEALHDRHRLDEARAAVKDIAPARGCPVEKAA